MAAVADWLNEHMQAVEATITIEEKLKDILNRNDKLTPFVPVEVYDNYEFTSYLVKEISTVAALIASGQEIPLIRAGQIEKFKGELFKAGLGVEYDEDTQKKMRKALELANLKRIAENPLTSVQNMTTVGGTIVRGTDELLARALFGNIETITDALFNILKYLTYQAIQFGLVNYESPLTSVSQQLDYRSGGADWGYAPYGKLAHFPPDLTGTAQAWDQYQTANGMNQLEEDLQMYRESNDGTNPDAIMMSETLKRHLRLQESTKRAFSSIVNTAANVVVSGVGLVSDRMLDQLLGDNGWPPIITNDEKFSLITYENGIQKEVKVRYFNEDRYAFLKFNMGQQAMGPTVEGDFAPGPYVVTYEKRKIPVLDVTEGVAYMLPVFPEPKYLFSRRVM